MENLKDKLKKGQIITFENENEFISADCKFEKEKDHFIIWFNGKLFIFKTFKGLENKLNQLIKHFDLNEKGEEIEAF